MDDQLTTIMINKTRWGIDIQPHCDAGPSSIINTKSYTYMGKDWEIVCPCGYFKHYTWVYPDFAIRLWNKERVLLTPPSK